MEKKVEKDEEENDEEENEEDENGDEYIEESSSEKSEEEVADDVKDPEIKNIKKPYGQVRRDLKSLDKADKEPNPSSKDGTDKETSLKGKLSTLKADDTAAPSNEYFRIIGMFMIILISGLIIFFKWPVIDSTPNHNFRSVEGFLSELSKMEEQFPNQYKLYWNMIKNGGKRHLKKAHDANEANEEKMTPQAYMIAGYEGSRETVDCYIEKLVLAFTTEKVDEKQVIDLDDFKYEVNPEILRTKLKSNLNGKKKLAVLKDLDKLQYSVAKLLMSYADEHNGLATYPQSLLFLTVQLPFSFDPSRTRKDDERLVNEHFVNEVWGSTDKEKKDALWSRVGNGLMLIKPEKTNACKKHEYKDL